MRTLEEPRSSRLSLVLFLCLFSSQSGVLVLSPILVDVAHDFGVSTTTAGQLRTISGFVAGVIALVIGRAAHRTSLRSLLQAGLGFLGVGSLLSAAAPSYAFLAFAQVPVGIGIALVLSAAVAAPGEWVSAEARSRVLSWTLIGNAGAWIVGMRPSATSLRTAISRAVRSSEASRTRGRGPSTSRNRRTSSRNRFHAGSSASRIWFRPSSGTNRASGISVATSLPSSKGTKASSVECNTSVGTRTSGARCVTSRSFLARRRRTAVSPEVDVL